MKTIKLLSSMLFVAAMATSTVSFGQVKIGTNPTMIEGTSNLEVEASTAGRKVKVDKTTGKLTIADGTQGANKILTSNANGEASWQSTPSSFIFFASNNNTLASPYTIPSGLVQGSIGQRIPFTPNFGTGYDAANKVYRIPAAGYYRITSGVRCVGTTTTYVEAVYVLQDGKYTPSDAPTTLRTTSSAFRSFSTVGYYPASQEISFFVYNVSGTDIGCFTGFMAVETITPPAP